jgi:hypothetical protein
VLSATKVSPFITGTIFDNVVYQTSQFMVVGTALLVYVLESIPKVDAILNAGVVAAKTAMVHAVIIKNATAKAATIEALLFFFIYMFFNDIDYGLLMMGLFYENAGIKLIIGTLGHLIVNPIFRNHSNSYLLRKISVLFCRQVTSIRLVSKSSSS